MKRFCKSLNMGLKHYEGILQIPQQGIEEILQQSQHHEATVDFKVPAEGRFER